MTDIRLACNIGIDNVSDKTTLPHGAVTDAVNVAIGRTGTFARRKGRQSVLAQTGCHSVWASDVRHESFAAVGGVLCKITMPWTATALYTLAGSAPLSYEDLNGDVIVSSRNEILVIAPDLSVRRLGVETPSPPRLTAANAGGLAAGTYGVAISNMAGNEEGALSRIVFVTLTAGQGLQLTIPPPIESLPTAVRIYRTGADDDVLCRAADVPRGVTSYLLGASNRGRQAKALNLDRMIPGDFVRHWNGRLWTVRNNVIFHSESLWYGVYSPRFRHISMGAAMRLFEPVKSGIFVGTREGMFFLSGNGPKEFSVIKKGAGVPFKNSAKRIPAKLLGKDGGDDYAIVWLSENGVAIGMADGSIREPQKERIELDASSATAAVVVHDRQVTVVVQ